MKKKKFLLLSFILPIIILIINLIVLKIFNPKVDVFSSKQILVADLKSQYLPLFNYLRNVLQGNDSIFYSFNNLLGGNMISTFAYYLSSPLNIIILFASSTNLLNYIYFLIFIKIGLCGLFMYLYLCHKKNNNYLSLIYSMFYALMAYNISYYFNIMWLDCIYLLPLLIYGIDNIIHKKDGKLYLIILSLTLISNFYIAYMVCIFSIIYFIYECIITYSKKDKKNIINSIKIFIICSILSSLISSILLIPTIIDLQDIYRGSLSNSMFIQKNLFNNFLVSLSKLYMLPQNPENILSSYTPNIYFGILPLLFSITYFYGSHKLKEKVVSLIIIIFFFLSFSLNNLNIFWHGLTLPNGYAYRFSFLFSFFMLLISYKSITNNDKLKISKFLLFIFILLFIGFNELTNGINISFTYFSLFLTILLFILYYIFINKKIILYLLVVIELVFHVNNSFFVLTNLKYDADYNYYLNKVCSLTSELDDFNYRLSVPLMFGGLESFACSDKRVASSITTNNKNIYNFMYNLGYTVTYSTVLSDNNTEISRSLIGINYYLDQIKESSIDKLTYKYSKDLIETYYLHENEYALPIGYLIENYEFTNDFDNAFEYQNLLLKSMSGLNKDVLLPFEFKKIDEFNYEVDVSNGKDIYIYINYRVPENEDFFSEITINDKVYDLDTFRTGVFKVDNDFDEEVIKVNVYNDEKKYNNFDNNAYFYYLDYEIFNEHLNILKENTLKINKLSKNYLSGKINANKDGYLFLSIPYEKGWNIYVDGKKSDYIKLYDTFIGIKLSKGSHKIEMKFYSPGLKIGLFLSIIGLILSILFFKNNHLIIYFKKKK